MIEATGSDIGPNVVALVLGVLNVVQVLLLAVIARCHVRADRRRDLLRSRRRD